MEIGVSARRRSVLALFITLGFVALSCSDRESPTSPTRSSASIATISGTLLAASDVTSGRGGTAASEPLAGVTVRAVSSGQTTQPDSAGRFTRTGLAPGSVTLQFSGAGIKASATVAVSAGTMAKVTVTANRGRSTVTVSPRSGAEGIVSKIAAPNFIITNPHGTFTIVTDSNTQFLMDGVAAGFGDLKVGDQVEVEGSPQTDGSILAARAEIESPPDQEATRTPHPTVTGTPVVTGTPPTARPTETPEPEDDVTRTPNPTLTVTPPTARPTGTPEPEDDVTRTPNPTLTVTPRD